MLFKKDNEDLLAGERVGDGDSIVGVFVDKTVPILLSDSELAILLAKGKVSRVAFSAMLGGGTETVLPARFFDKHPFDDYYAFGAAEIESGQAADEFGAYLVEKVLVWHLTKVVIVTKNPLIRGAIHRLADPGLGVPVTVVSEPGPHLLELARVASKVIILPLNATTARMLP